MIDKVRNLMPIGINAFVDSFNTRPNNINGILYKWTYLNVMHTLKIVLLDHEVFPEDCREIQIQLNGWRFRRRDAIFMTYYILFYPT